MQRRVLFRLLLRLVGILLFVQMLPYAIQTAGWLVENFGQLSTGPSAGGTYNAWPVFVGSTIAALLEVAIPIYLMTAPNWIVTWAAGPPYAHCAHCGYRLRGLPAEGRCPECGTPYKRPDGESSG